MLLAPLGVNVPSNIEDLTALFAAGFVKWDGSAFVRADAVEDAIRTPLTYERLSVQQILLPSGTTVVALNIPVGQRLIASSNFIFSNPTTAAITAALSLRRAGIDYGVSGNVSIAARVGGGASVGIGPLVFEPGDSLIIVTSAQGLSYAMMGYLIPNTGSALVPKSIVLGIGNNTLYTCPAGKLGTIVAWNLTNTPNGQIPISNFSGSTRICSYHIVPSAGSPDATNKFGESSIGNGNITLASVPRLVMVAGESLVLVMDGSGTPIICYPLIEEADAP